MRRFPLAVWVSILAAGGAAAAAPAVTPDGAPPVVVDSGACPQLDNRQLTRLLALEVSAERDPAVLAPVAVAVACRGGRLQIIVLPEGTLVRELPEPAAGDPEKERTVALAVSQALASVRSAPLPAPPAPAPPARASAPAAPRAPAPAAPPAVVAARPEGMFHSGVALSLDLGEGSAGLGVEVWAPLGQRWAASLEAHGERDWFAADHQAGDVDLVLRRGHIPGVLWGRQSWPLVGEYRLLAGAGLRAQQLIASGDLIMQPAESATLARVGTGFGSTIHTGKVLFGGAIDFGWSWVVHRSEVAFATPQIQGGFWSRVALTVGLDLFPL